MTGKRASLLQQAKKYLNVSGGVRKKVVKQKVVPKKKPRVVQHPKVVKPKKKPKTPRKPKTPVKKSWGTLAFEAGQKWHHMKLKLNKTRNKKLLKKWAKSEAELDKLEKDFKKIPKQEWTEFQHGQYYHAVVLPRVANDTLDFLERNKQKHLESKQRAQKRKQQREKNAERFKSFKRLSKAEIEKKSPAQREKYYIDLYEYLAWRSRRIPPSKLKKMDKYERELLEADRAEYKRMKGILEKL